MLLVVVSTATAKTCFQWAWPVTYRPIPLCVQPGDACYKYVVNDEGYGWFCDNVADGAKACEIVNAQITFDEALGTCNSNGSCQFVMWLYFDVPRTGEIAHDVPCYE